MAVHDGLSTRVWSLALRKGARERMGEDAVASRLALHALASACGGALYPGAPGLPPRDTLEICGDETPQVTPRNSMLEACSSCATSYPADLKGPGPRGAPCLLTARMTRWQSAPVPKCVHVRMWRTHSHYYFFRTGDGGGAGEPAAGAVGRARARG